MLISGILSISLFFIAFTFLSNTFAVGSTPTNDHKCGTIAGECEYRGIIYKRSVVTDINYTKWSCGFGTTTGPNPTAKECKIPRIKITPKTPDAKVKTPVVTLPKVEEKKDKILADDDCLGTLPDNSQWWAGPPYPPTWVKGEKFANHQDLPGENTEESCDFHCNTGYTWYRDFTETAEGIAIEDCEELQKIGNELEYPLNGTYNLMNDIDCSATNPSDPDNPGSVWDNGGKGFAPIGSGTRGFKGSFNGNCHVISDLYINRPDNTEEYTGLFALVNGLTGGVIENLKIKGSVTGYRYVGILAGVLMDGSQINNVSTVGDVNGKYSAGGLSGDSGESFIQNSFSEASVFGTDYIGGLVGETSTSQIKNSYARGTVTGTAFVGGLVGQVTRNSMIQNTYATGDVVSNAANSGGLAGVVYSESSVKSSYAVGKVTAYAGGGLVGKIDNKSSIQESYWAKDSSGKEECISDGHYNGCMGANKNNLLGKNNPFYVTGLWDFVDDWTETNSHPLLTTASACGTCLEDIVVMDEKCLGSLPDNSNWWASAPYPPAWVKGEKFANHQDLPGENIEESCDFHCNPDHEWQVDFTKIEQGTPIYNCTDLQNIKNDLKGTYYLANDIDCSMTNPLDPRNVGSVWNNGGRGFEPIGDNLKIGNIGIEAEPKLINPFRGKLYGNCHTILNLYIKRSHDASTASTNEHGNGLFDQIENATISNLKIINAEVWGYNNNGILVSMAVNSVLENITTSGILHADNASAGVVGRLINGSISNSKSSVIIDGKDMGSKGAEGMGGLVGYAKTSKISNSYASGSVLGHGTVGGLLGSGYTVNISNSYTLGDVSEISFSSTSQGSGGLCGYLNYSSVRNSYAINSIKGYSESVGGLCGSILDSSIENSFVNTNVYSSGYRAGGLAGYGARATVKNSYAKGVVNGKSSILSSGGLFGKLQQSSTITNSYADVDVTGADNVGGLVGLLDNSKILSSYSIGKVNSVDDASIGGLVGGMIAGTFIKDSYATGKIAGKGSVGELIGYRAPSQAILENVFWSEDANILDRCVGNGSSDGCASKNQADFEGDTHNFYLNNLWNFSNVWEKTATNPGLRNVIKFDLNALIDKCSGSCVETDKKEKCVWVKRTSSGEFLWENIASSADGSILAATVRNDHIHTSHDSGFAWIEETGSGRHFWEGIASSADGSKLAAAARNSYIYTSTDSGLTWEDQTLSDKREWTDIASSVDGSNLAATVKNDYIYTSPNSGLTWVQQTNPGKKNWVGIASSADGLTLAAITSNDYIYTSTNGGYVWTEQIASEKRDWVGIASSADGKKLVAIVKNGYIYTSTNGGVNWTEQISAGKRDWMGIASSNNGIKLSAVAYGDFIYTSVNSGVTWIEQTLLGKSNWFDIASSADGTKLAAVDSDGYVYTYDCPDFSLKERCQGPLPGNAEWHDKNNWPDFPDWLDLSAGDKKTHIYRESDDALQSCDFKCIDGYTWKDDTLKQGQPIRNCDDLQIIIKSNLKGTYYLDGPDGVIDCSATNPNDSKNAGSLWDNGGKGFEPIDGKAEDWEDLSDLASSFSGTLYGNCNSINNLYINRPDTNFVGLFSVVYLGSIRNVKMLDFEIIGHKSVGALAGSIVGAELDGEGDIDINSKNKKSKIEDITLEGSILGTHAAYWKDGYYKSDGTESNIGGMFGSSIQIDLDNCDLDVDVKGNTRVGGMIGQAWLTNIQRCKTRGTIAHNGFGDTKQGDELGGLVGIGSGNISDSYSLMKITGGEIGGLVGQSDFVIKNSYFAGELIVKDEDLEWGKLVGTGGGLVHDNNNGTIQDSFNAGSFSSDTKDSVGGVVYSNNSPSKIINSYWPNGEIFVCYIENKGEVDDCDSRDKKVFYNKMNSPMGLWDFNKIWKENTDAYPTLANTGPQCGLCVRAGAGGIVNKKDGGITINVDTDTSTIGFATTSTYGLLNSYGVDQNHWYNQFQGQFIMRAKARGETYYVSPVDTKVYYLSSANDAYTILGKLGTGITEFDLSKVKATYILNLNKPDTDQDGLPDDFEILVKSDPKNSDTDGDGYNDGEEHSSNHNINGPGLAGYSSSFTSKHLGKIFLDVDNNGEAWYFNPKDRNRYYLGTPADAFAVMKYLALGIDEATFKKLIGE